ncbi:hypothetical protein [Spiroplasma endosymbiont of Labia minor]|uniref:hypothetical protein n=1 Tax=Spiroplasma endosymbiont of Labia minor TaxID=3066305 RepID=UPI0030D1F386
MIDLLYVYPVLIGVAYVSQFYFLRQESFNLKWRIFAVELLCFWIPMGFVTKMNMDQFNLFTEQVPNQTSTSIESVLAIFGATGFFTIILKPLATFITGRLHHRRFWIWPSHFSLLLTIIFTYLNLNHQHIVYIVFTAIFFAFSLSSSSLWYLIIQEQLFQRTNPFTTATITTGLYLLGNFTGTYFWTLLQQEIAVTNWRLSVGVVLLVCILSNITSFCLGFFNKEESIYVRGYGNKTIHFDKYKKIYLLYVIVMSLLISSIFNFMNCQLMQFYLLAFNNIDIQWFFRLQDAAGFIPEILVGFLIYHFIKRKISQTVWLTICSSLVTISVVLIFIIHNIYFLAAIYIILGLMYTQITYSLFSMAIYWNYRTKGTPVTGYAASATTAGNYLSIFFIRVMQINSIGAFRYLNGKTLSTLTNDDLIILQNNYWTYGSILIGTCIAFSFILVLMIVFLLKEFTQMAHNIDDAIKHDTKILYVPVKGIVNNYLTPSSHIYKNNLKKTNKHL